MEQVINEIIKVCIPTILTAVGVVIADVIRILGKAGVSLLEQKCKESNLKSELAKHDKELQIAKNIFAMVDEEYRISSNLSKEFNSKSEMFDKLLKDKIPYLTDNEINMLRQSVAGVINAGKEVVEEQLPETIK